MARRHTIYDEEGSFKSGRMEDYDRVRRLREQEQSAEDFNEFLGDEAASRDKKGGKGQSQGKSADSKEGDDKPYKYTGKGSQSDKQRDKKHTSSGKRRKRGMIIGGIGGAGLIGGIGLFSMTLGPLQFVHLSKVLTGRDFAAQEQSDDDRLLRLLRYWRFAAKGQTERTRLGHLGNKLGDRYEARLNSTGWTSGYSSAFGFFDGFVVDRSAPEYRGMNDQQLVRHIQEKDGITPKRGSEYPGNYGFKNNTFIVPASDLRVYTGRKFIANRLQEAGASKISSAIGARILQKRGGGTSLFHPLKKLDEATLRQVDKLYVKWKERRLRNIKAKRVAISTSLSEKEGASDSEKGAAADAQAQADEILGEAAEADEKLSSGQDGSIEGFRNSLGFKVAGGVAGGIGIASIPCILDSLADNARLIKKENEKTWKIRLNTFRK